MQVQRLIVLCLTVLLMSCSSKSIPWVYRIDIPQGNLISQAQLNRLKLGMSKSDVTFIMGSPMLQDVFHQDRWDYYYRFTPGKGAIQQYHVALYFKDEHLSRIVPLDTEALPLSDATTT